jgi:hypothetical protein
VQASAAASPPSHCARHEPGIASANPPNPRLILQEAVEQKQTRRRIKKEMAAASREADARAQGAGTRAQGAEARAEGAEARAPGAEARVQGEGAAAGRAGVETEATIGGPSGEVGREAAAGAAPVGVAGGGGVKVAGSGGGGRGGVGSGCVGSVGVGGEGVASVSAVATMAEAAEAAAGVAGWAVVGRRQQRGHCELEGGVRGSEPMQEGRGRAVRALGGDYGREGGRACDGREADGGEEAGRKAYEGAGEEDVGEAGAGEAGMGEDGDEALARDRETFGDWAVASSSGISGSGRPSDAATCVGGAGGGCQVSAHGAGVTGGGGRAHGAGGGRGAGERGGLVGGAGETGEPTTPAGWLPPVDLVMAGGRVRAESLDMESVARQSAAFASTLAASIAGAAAGGAASVSGSCYGAGHGNTGGVHSMHATSAPPPPAALLSPPPFPHSPPQTDAAQHSPSTAWPGQGGDGDGGSRQVAALQRQLQALQLRVAAERQCVTREQHITARMWLEKSRAEEAAAEQAARVEELQGVIAQWEVSAGHEPLVRTLPARLHSPRLTPHHCHTMPSFPPPRSLPTHLVTAPCNPTS